MNAEWQRAQAPACSRIEPTRIVYACFPELNDRALPASSAAGVAHERSLTRISLALAGYQAEHNEYPAILDALAPTWLPALPTDPFTDLPFHYAKTPTGYRLYSVGPNGIDDDGHTRDQHDAAHPKPDDITVTIPPSPPAP